MHTDDALTGPICKCQRCVEARNRRLVRQARLRYPEEFRLLNEDVARCEAELGHAYAALSRVTRGRIELLDRVRRDILGESGTA